MVLLRTALRVHKLYTRIMPRLYSTTYETKQGIENRVLKVLHAFNKIKPETIALKARFGDELGLDSLDVVEVLMAIEEEFAMEIPDIEADKMMTPGDAVLYIHRKMAEMGTAVEDN